jgi:hypothetical protein
MATTGDGAVAKYNAGAVDPEDALEVEFVAAEDDGTVEAVEEAQVGVDEAVEKMAEQMKV